MYNVEQYVPRFLEALLSQTYSNLEIILVDDGSTDSTSGIIDEYATKDARVKAVHQPNGGIGAARLAGMKLMTGFYCLQLDADDTFETDMVEQLVKETEQTDADLTFCDYDIIYSDRTETVIRQLDTLDRVHYLKAQFVHGMWSVYWNKLFKTSVLREARVLPILGIQNWEDYAVTNRIVIHCSKIAYVRKVLYHYNRTNVNATTAVPKESHYHDILRAVAVVAEAVEASDIRKDVADELGLLKLRQKEFLLFTAYRNFDKWRTTFPEVNQGAEKEYQGLERRVVRAVASHRDIVAWALLAVRKLCNLMRKR